MARGDAAPAKFEGIRAGKTILKEDPFACILFSRYRKIRCDNCFKKYEFFLLFKRETKKSKIHHHHKNFYFIPEGKFNYV